MNEALGIMLVTLAVRLPGRQPRLRRAADPPTPSGVVRDRMAQGRPVAAIRPYRKRNGATLLEARHVT